MKLRPHKVLSKNNGINEKDETHALCLGSGDFSGIIFSYKNVNFKEDQENDKLIIHFEYEVHEVPSYRKDYDKVIFEKELGDFLVELLYYGLERDHLGYVEDQ